MPRQCRICLSFREESEFSSNGRKLAVENRCKECVSRSAKIIRGLKKISPPKPKRCDCCNKEADKLCLDHCHKTLRFRGWICPPCNRGIGQLGDNIEGLQKAMNYLRKQDNKKSWNLISKLYFWRDGKNE